MKKRFKEKLMAVLTIMLVAMSMTMPYYASGVDTIRSFSRLYETQMPIYEWGFPSGYDEEVYPYWVVFNGSDTVSSSDYKNKMLFFCSTEPICVVTSFYNNQNLVRYGSVGSSKCWTSSNGNSWGTLSNNNPNIVYIKDDGTYGASVDYSYFVESNHDICFENTEIRVYEAKTAEVYNADLGYLKGVSVRTLYLEDENGEMITNSGLYQIRFSDNSTTNIDLTEDCYGVRVWGQYAVFKHNGMIGGWKKLTPDDIDLLKYMTLYIGDNPTRIEFVKEDFTDFVYDNTAKEVKDKYPATSVLDNRLWYPTIYLQIVKETENGIEYGGYTRLEMSFNNGFDDSEFIIGTYDDKFNVDVNNGGYNGDVVVNGTGSGSSYGDASDLVDKELENNNANLDGVGEFLSSIGGLIDLLGDFPMVISKVFGFLPDWCLGMFATGFGVLIVILIVKAIRG